MTDPRGTPKTLNQAIGRVIGDLGDKCGCGNCKCCDFGVTEQLEAAVRDFLAQRFTEAMWKSGGLDNALNDLFKKITARPE